MRILMVAHQYPPSHLGGTEIYTQTLARALSRRGHTAAVFWRDTAPGMGLEREEQDGVQVLRVWAGTPDARRRFLATWGDSDIGQAFERTLDELRPDVVHIQHLMGLPPSIVRSARQRGLPLFITLHDYWWVCANAQLVTNYDQRACPGPRAYGNCGRCLLARGGMGQAWPLLPGLAALAAWRNRLWHSVLLQADQLIAPSAYVREWYTSHGVPAKKIEVLPHGLEWPADLKRQERPVRPVRLAYVGGLAWQKGVHVLLEAFGQIRGPAELWIAGDESCDPAYAARLHALAAQGVSFLGKLDRRGVWDTLTQVDAVMVPALWPETFSLIIREAAAAGVPALASRMGALPEALVDGENGLLIAAGDVQAWRTAMQRLVDDADLLPRLRAHVRPPWTLEEHARRIEHLYAQALTGSGV